MTIKLLPTNRELAERFGVSTRTVRRATSGRRACDWWPVFRQEVRKEAARLRATGMTWAQIGEAMGITAGAARAAAKRATGEWADGSAAPENDDTTGDLFAVEPTP